MKKRIAFVASSLEGGGAERIFLNILNSLPLEKYELLLLCTSGHSATGVIRDGVVFKSYNRDHAKSCFFNLCTDLRRFSPDYVFTSHFPVAYMLPIIRALNRQNFQVVIRVAVPPSDVPKRELLVNLKHHVAKCISRMVYRKADLIIAQTEAMKADLLSHYPLDADRVRVIRNVIDAQQLETQGAAYIPPEFEKGAYNIVAAGALYSVKGFDVLIRAIGSVVKVHPRVRLYILGKERYEQGYRDRLESLIRSMSLQDHVNLVGYKDNPCPYYRQADLFVLSSRKEGYPNVVLEALYYHTPVVATDCVDFTGVIVDSENGYVVKKDNHEELAGAILRAYANLSKPCKAELENFNYEEVFR